MSVLISASAFDLPFDAIVNGVLDLWDRVRISESIG